MPKTELHKKVKFKGEVYWLHEARHGFNLSPLNHYDDMGDLTVDPFHAIAYAIVDTQGDILRFGEQIGTMSDLEDVE